MANCVGTVAAISLSLASLAEASLPARTEDTLSHRENSGGVSSQLLFAEDIAHLSSDAVLRARGIFPFTEIRERMSKDPHAVYHAYDSVFVHAPFYTDPVSHTLSIIDNEAKEFEQLDINEFEMLNSPEQGSTLVFQIAPTSRGPVVRFIDQGYGKALVLLYRYKFA